MSHWHSTESHWKCRIKNKAFTFSEVSQPEAQEPSNGGNIPQLDLIMNGNVKEQLAVARIFMENMKILEKLYNENDWSDESYSMKIVEMLTQEGTRWQFYFVCSIVYYWLEIYYYYYYYYYTSKSKWDFDYVTLLCSKF